MRHLMPGKQRCHLAVVLWVPALPGTVTWLLHGVSAQKSLLSRWLPQQQLAMDLQQ